MPDTANGFVKIAVLIGQDRDIDTPLLKQLVRVGKAGELVVRGVPGGFVVAMRDGVEEDILVAQRGGARTFKRLESAASFLKQIGVRDFSVSLDNWSTRALF